MILCTQNVAATSFFIHRAEILISSRDEIKRCIAAKRRICGGILGKLFCEYSCGNCIGGGSTLFWHTVVGCDTYSKNSKMGVTLPVLKNEIIDFFFARLGTGGNYDPTLLFWERTERRYIYKWYGFLGEIFNKHIGSCML